MEKEAEDNVQVFLDRAFSGKLLSEQIPWYEDHRKRMQDKENPDPTVPKRIMAPRKSGAPPLKLGNRLNPNPLAHKTDHFLKATIAALSMDEMTTLLYEACMKDPAMTERIRRLSFATQVSKDGEWSDMMRARSEEREQRASSMPGKTRPSSPRRSSGSGRK